MLRSRNDLQLELLAETDFGGVVTVDRHFLEDGEEIVLHLEIAAFGLPERRAGPAVPARPGDGGGVIDREQEDKQLFPKSKRPTLFLEGVCLFCRICHVALRTCCAAFS